MGSENVEHGLYGSMLHALGTCVGCVGAIPCCPLPNPFRNVQQGIIYFVYLSPIAFDNAYLQVLWDSFPALATSTRR